MHILEKTKLLTVLQKILLDNPAGLSEHALIKCLKHQQQPVFISADLSDVLSLFRTHFVLFHTLYHLRDTLRASERFDLQISPLLIRLQAACAQTNAQQQALKISDPLRKYYLNLDHLSGTDRAAVEQLLYNSLISLTPPPEVSDALIELGIEQPLHTLSEHDLRSCYRQLVSIHHPDRGGCTERIQRINQAMDTLWAHHALSR